jgi:hypothetical protein
MICIVFGETKINSATQRLLENLRKKGFKAITGMKKEEQQRLWLWAQKVSGQYGKVLSRIPWNLKKASELPFPKEDIQLAIKLMLLPHITRGRTKVVRVLRDRYADLASFQEIDEGDRDRLTKFIDPKDGKSNRFDRNTFPLHNKYAERVVSERKYLIEDINDFINNI